MVVVAQPFGTLLREYRVTAGVSQEALAERAGLSVETISALERGARRSPYGQTVARLADALALSEEQRRALEGASFQPRARRRGGSGATPVVARPEHNIPSPTTRLVGREKLVSTVSRLLAEARFVTLTGPPGVGKTRVALAVAADALRSFPDGAWLVELAPVVHGDDIAPAVGTLFGLRDQGERRREQAVAQYLHHKRLLLVLDNCEHVLLACAQLVSLLLQSCPDVHVLATSREPLRLQGEQCLRVPSLSLPAGDAEGLSPSDSETLFVERAGQVEAAFTVQPSDAAAIATICRRLDGIPLALELAAARTRTIPVTRIASALDDRFRLLTHGDRTALHRHQTLEALFEWSYDLLTQKERILFRRLGIFTGSWTLELATDTCADDELGAHEILDLLQSLIDKSLVVADFQREAPYRLLETTREYARERLTLDGELERVTRRHAEALRDIAVRAHEEWHTGNDDAALRPIAAAIDNVRVALDWAFSTHGDRRVGAALIAELLQVWVLIGGVAEGLHWVQRALETPVGGGAAIDGETVARLHLAAGLLNLHLTQPTAAIASGEQALAFFRAAGDRNRVVEALDFFGRALRHNGRCEEALRAQEEGFELARAAQLPRFSAQFICWRASVEAELGRFDDARRHLEEAAALFRALGYARGLYFVRSNMVHVEFGAGNYRGAIELGRLAFAERQSAGVEGLWSLPQVLAYRAAANIAVGALDEARADAVDAIDRARQMSEMTILSVAVEQLALVAALRGNLRLAARLLAYSQGTRPANCPRLRTEQVSYGRLIALLQGLDPDERERLMAHSVELDEDALVAEALSV